MTAPWQTLNGAASHLMPGDLVYLRGGTYSGSASLHLSGTASAPITFAGYPGERALVTNPSTSTNTETVSIYGSYLTFDHLAFSNQHNPGQVLATVPGANYNVFSNSEIYGSQNIGFVVQSDYNQVLNNSIHDNGTRPNFDHGLYVQGANNVVRGNTIYNNFTYGIQLYNGHGVIAGGNLIEKNYIYHNGYGSAAAGFNYTAGIILSTAEPNTTIRYNVLCNNAQFGLYAEDGTVTGNQVISNVSCYNPSGGFFFQATGSGTTATGNVSYNDNKFAMGLDAPVTSDKNTYFVAGATPMFLWNGSTMSLASFNTASGQDLHSQIADPKFTSVPSSGYDWTQAKSYNFCTSLIPALCQ
jgi:hypothetical protein